MGPDQSHQFATSWMPFATSVPTVYLSSLLRPMASYYFTYVLKNIGNYEKAATCSEIRFVTKYSFTSLQQTREVAGLTLCDLGISKMLANEQVLIDLVSLLEDIASVPLIGRCYSDFDHMPGCAIPIKGLVQ